MKLILVAFILTSSQAFAHCPYEINVGTDQYCLDIDWQNGQKIVKGQITDVTEMSPYLNKQSVLPNQWIYSRALIPVWKKGDKKHTPVVLPDFMIYPYMQMTDGMHHGASFGLSYDEQNQAYDLSAMSFQEMDGCWSLRWQIGKGSDSGALLSISDYVNIDATEKANIIQICSSLGTPVEGGDHQGHEHHH